MTDTGKTFRFGQGDLGWCTSCQVFLILSTKIGAQYTISGTPKSRL